MRQITHENPLNPSDRTFIAIIILAALSLQGCSAYRVVSMGPGVDDQNIVRPFYAVVRNHVLIPEYVIDEYGNYPTSADEARARFESRKKSLESVVSGKYDLPRDVPYQLKRGLVGSGFILISPVAVPVQCLGELFSTSQNRRPVPKVVEDYFDSGFNPPLYDKPRIRERIDIFY